jgi:hypothetical protein
MAYSTTFVYTLNQVGSVGAWSRYIFNFRIDDYAQLNNSLYVRSEDTIYIMDDTRIYDEDADGNRVDVVAEIRWPYLDFGAPGVTKQMIGYDMVGNGTCSTQIGYSQLNFDLLTPAYEHEADTLPGNIIPVPISAPSFSLRILFSSEDNRRWEWLGSNFYLQDFRMTS